MGTHPSAPDRLHWEMTMPARRLPPGEKKDVNLQTRVDLDYYGDVKELSEALGYKKVAHFLRALTDNALKNSDEMIADRQRELEEEAREVERALEQQKARLAEVAANTARRRR